MTTRIIDYVTAINETLSHEMDRNQDVIIMGEDIAGGGGRADQGFIDAWGGPFGATRGLIKKFGPDRVRDTPLSECGFVGAGIGAACTAAASAMGRWANQASLPSRLCLIAVPSPPAAADQLLMQPPGMPPQVMT